MRKHLHRQHQSVRDDAIYVFIIGDRNAVTSDFQRQIANQSRTAQSTVSRIRDVGIKNCDQNEAMSSHSKYDVFVTFDLFGIHAR